MKAIFFLLEALQRLYIDCYFFAMPAAVLKALSSLTPASLSR